MLLINKFVKWTNVSFFVFFVKNKISLYKKFYIFICIRERNVSDIYNS